MSRNAETVWKFSTARFRIALELEPEEMDPADSFEFQEDIDAVRNETVLWFAARVVVYLDDREIGSDSLGGCAYRTAADFYTPHRDADPMNRNSSIMRAERGKNAVICHYFPELVRLAVRDARGTLARAPHLRAA